MRDIVRAWMHHSMHPHCPACAGCQPPMSEASDASKPSRLQALTLLRAPALRTGALGLLYHLSMERAHRPLFRAAPPGGPGAAAALPALLLAAGDLRAAPELAALAVNLSLDDALAAARAPQARMRPALPS